MQSYDVRFHKIRKREDRPRRPYEVRWNVGPKLKAKSFATKALADNYRSKLMAAARAGEEFDTVTGEPVSWAETHSITWLEHARSYVQMKWPRVAARNRVSLADALATITPALVTTQTGKPDAKVLRTALFGWVFNPSRSTADQPKEIVDALGWLESVSLRVSDLADTAAVRRALEALSLKLDGTVAAAATISRKRAIFHNALGYAVELELLPVNPLSKVQWSPPEVAEEVDRRVVANPAQVRLLLDAVRDQGERGRRLTAFFGCLYFAAMRPSEVSQLLETDCHLPAQGWGRLILSKSAPYAGTAWTDDGQAHEERPLKRRSRQTVRVVPIPPVLVTLLRQHLAEFGTAEDGRMFQAARGGYVPVAEYGKVWREARKQALSPSQRASPLAARPYDLRHGGVSLWLNAGVPATLVARRAGHSVAVLLKVYAGCLDGEDTIANDRIDTTLATYAEAFDASDPGAADPIPDPDREADTDEEP